jgi:hypothetical protein
MAAAIALIEKQRKMVSARECVHILVEDHTYHAP